MPIDPEALRQWPIAEIEHTYTARDTMLYALGLGCGGDPLDENQLRFVYEGRLQALPSMSVVLGYPGFWIGDPATGADWKKVLHGEQVIEIFKPLPTAATVIGKSRVTGLFDKGKDKGAVLVSERDVVDKSTGDVLCRLTSTTMLRGDGGFGGPSGPLVSPRCPKPHLSTVSPAIIIRCTPTPRWRAAGDSKSRSCTGSARSAWSAAPCLMRFAATIRRNCARCRSASARRSFRERPS
jgi:hypothetical protein